MFKLGRRRPDPHHLRLSMRNYLNLSTLPTPPTTTDYRAPAASSLSQMYLNDQVGDCVWAGMAHLEGVWTANGTPGTPLLFSDADIQQDYETTGYVPGDPSTDNGTDEVTAMNWWMRNTLGANAQSVYGWASVDATNMPEVRACCWLFEGLMAAVELPAQWLQSTQAPGFVWDIAGYPVPQNGHCPPFLDLSADGMICSTWGMTGTVTTQAIERYYTEAEGGALYAVLTHEVLQRATQKTSAGFDWTQMLADLQAVGGKVSA